MSSILGVVAGPEPGGRTAAAVAGLLAGAEKAGDTTDLVELSQASFDDVTSAFAEADAVVFGSPVYRAGHTASLRALLEATERGRWGEKTAPLQGKAAAVVLTGASGHHFLAVDGLRSVLAGFFAVQVLSPGLYLDHSGYVDRNTLTPESAELAAGHGRALSDLTAAVRSSEALRTITPVV